MKLYSETVPFDQWVQIESTITKEELETAQAAEEEKSMRCFMSGSMAMTASFQRATARNSWMWPYGCAIMYEEALRQ